MAFIPQGPSTYWLGLLIRGEKNSLVYCGDVGNWVSKDCKAVSLTDLVNGGIKMHNQAT